MFISEELLVRSLEKFNIVPTPEQIEMFDRYASLLCEWNEKFNLTAIKSPDDIVVKHFADSLSILNYCNIPEKSKLIDVGTGAGFPGLPLIIMKKDISVTFLDSTGKKLKFIEEVLNELSLSGETVTGRAEEYGKNENFREKYDFATARAVSELKTVSELCIPFLKKGGVFIAMKGAGAGEEIKNCGKALELLGGEIVKRDDFEIDSCGERSLIFIRKISQTPTKYPRNYSQIIKHPLV